MPSTTFHSDRPDLFGADVDHGELGRRYEALITSPEYMNRNHMRHNKAVCDAQALADAIWGDKPIDGGQPFSGQTINSADGNVLDPTALQRQYAPTVFNPSALADEHNKVD